MKHIILAITISLMVPAYAQSVADKGNKVGDTATKLSDLVEESLKKPLPPNDLDKKAIKEAMENFDKALKDYYELEKKPAKKKGATIMRALQASNARLGLPRMTPVLINGQPGSINQLGGFTTAIGPAFGNPIVQPIH